MKEVSDVRQARDQSDSHAPAGSSEPDACTVVAVARASLTHYMQYHQFDDVYPDAMSMMTGRCKKNQPLLRFFFCLNFLLSAAVTGN